MSKSKYSIKKPIKVANKNIPVKKSVKISIYNNGKKWTWRIVLKTFGYLFRASKIC
jgi:hypothetical protein